MGSLLTTSIIVIIVAIIATIITRFILSKKNNEQAISKDIKERDGKIEELNKTITHFKSQISQLESQLVDNEKILMLLKEGDVTSITNELQSQLSKLQKELKNTQQELEDMEDEASDYKKKWNNQKGILSETQQRLEEVEKSLKEKSEHLDKIESELKDKKEDLQQRERALKFVNEILNAKQVNDEDTKKFNSIVRQIEDFVSQDFCDSLLKFREITPEEAKSYKEKIWQWANLQRKSWLKEKKIVAFVGEFSAGKTSIVNRILSQDNDKSPKLPVSSKATTAIPTYISHGSDFLSSFTDQNGALKNIKKETFEMVNKDILSQVNVSSLIGYFVMKYNNNNLKDLSILDTPGFSSNDKDDARRTADVIREADVLFWVFDANSGEINQTSIEIIRENLQELPLFIVINKADTKSPGELDKLEEHIRKTIHNNRINVRGYIRFSQKAQVKELMDAISTVPKGNNKDEYIDLPFLKMDEEVKEADDDCKKYRATCNSLERDIENLTKRISKLYQSIRNSSEYIATLPQSKKSFFGLGSEYFKMDKYAFDDFCFQVNEIIGANASAEQLGRELVEKEKSLQYSKTELEKAKEQKAELDHLQRQLVKLIKEWKPKYSPKIR